MKTQDIKTGIKVYYTSPTGTTENGIIKSFNDSKTTAWVVYKCNNEWDRYSEYTGQATIIEDLTLGWKEKSEVSNNNTKVNIAKRTKGVWYSEVIEKEGEIHIFSSLNPSQAICSLYSEPLQDDTKQDAAFIVTACNNYDKLIEALKNMCEVKGEGIDAEIKAYDKAKQLLNQLNESK